MRFEKKRTVANAGVIYVRKVVNEHGSIFHHVHQENVYLLDPKFDPLHEEFPKAFEELRGDAELRDVVDWILSRSA